jgi:signal transduction histidine kinase
VERRYEAILSSPLWLVLIAALLIGAPVIALGEVAAGDARARSSEAEWRATKIATERAAAAIEDWVKIVTAQVAVVTQPAISGKATSLAVAVQAHDAAALQAELARLRSWIEPELPLGAFDADLVVLDAQNLTVAVDPPNRVAIGVDRSARPYAGGAVQADAVTVTAPFRAAAAGSQVADPNGNLLVAVIGRMTEPGTRQPLGSLVVNVSARILTDPIQALLPAAQEAYVVDGSGRLVVRASHQFAADSATFADLSGGPLIAAALASPLAGSRFDDPFGAGTLLATSTTVSGLGWRIVSVSQPSIGSRELDSTLSQQRLVRIFLIALLLVAAYVLAVTARRTIRQRRELADANVRIADANQAKSQFLASMSHELRTPLNAVIGFADVLGQRMFGELNPRQAEYVNDIIGSGRHLLSLINDILDLAKVEAGRMQLEPNAFSLREVLGNGVTMVRERAANHGIALSLDVAPDVDVITADERKVKQVVFNLLSNAVKFTPDGGRIAVSATRTKGEVQIAVRDSGVGIAPNDQARLFKEFAQTADGRHAAEGTGLGLTLAKRFVELHGGRIWVDSQVGAGSTFTFALPSLLEPAAS